MQIKSDLADAVGNTPLIKLRAASEATGCTILGCWGLYGVQNGHRHS